MKNTDPTNRDMNLTPVRAVPGFEGFADSHVATPNGQLRVRSGGNGPPLLLLHGYPQTSAMWHAIAPMLREHFTLICPDLLGYGDSSKPSYAANHAPYSKREMADEIVALATSLGLDRFFLAGHDRGGRVAYRLALDHPERVKKLAILDVLPTYSTWESMSWRQGLGAYHWYFLAQPAPLPERLISAESTFYLRSTLSRWAQVGFEFHPDALAEYEHAFSNPDTIRACCEDYRAGATIDYDLDAADFGRRKITCPVLVLWGLRPPAPPRDFLPAWRQWATDLQGAPLPCGHFLAEEAPESTAKKLLQFFA